MEFYDYTISKRNGKLQQERRRFSPTASPPGYSYYPAPQKYPQRRPPIAQPDLPKHPFTKNHYGDTNFITNNYYKSGTKRSRHDDEREYQFRRLQDRVERLTEIQDENNDRVARQLRRERRELAQLSKELGNQQCCEEREEEWYRDRHPGSGPRRLHRRPKPRSFKKDGCRCRGCRGRH